MSARMYPVHLNDCVEDASQLFSGKASDYHKHYQIKCSCGADLFELLVSNRKSVLAKCASCGARILVYDLAFYPAAVKLTGEETFRELEGGPGFPSRIYVQYEYGLLDADEPFDRNDVTWCSIFAESIGGELRRVFDDETA